MPIYQLDPNAANRQQLQFFMSQIALFAMQRAQQKARLEEQERELAMTQQRIDLARSEEGWMKGKAPTEKKQVEMAGVKSPLAPEGKVTVQQRPDVEAMESGGEQFWRYKQELKTMKLGDYEIPYVQRGGRIMMMGGALPIERGWKPTSREEALEFERAKRESTGWKPRTMDEAIRVRQAGRQPALTFEQQKELAGIRRGDQGQPKGRTAEANWWAEQLSVDLKTEKGRAAVKRVMDTLYGRGDTERKMFLDAFRAARDPLLDPQENIAAAQELYNKLQTSEQNREVIQEQYPDARYDFASSKWYVVRDGKKYWVEMEE